MEHTVGNGRRKRRGESFLDRFFYRLAFAVNRYTVGDHDNRREGERIKLRYQVAEVFAKNMGIESGIRT